MGAVHSLHNTQTYARELLVATPCFMVLFATALAMHYIVLHVCWQADGDGRGSVLLGAYASLIQVLVAMYQHTLLLVTRCLLRWMSQLVCQTTRLCVCTADPAGAITACSGCSATHYCSLGRTPITFVSFVLLLCICAAMCYADLPQLVM